MGNGQSSAGNSCNTICWVLAIVFGILIAVILHNWADWSWLVSIVVGVIGALGLGWLLTSYFCDEQISGASDTPMHAGGITAAGAGDAAADGSHEVDDAARVAKVDPGTPAYAGGVSAAGAGEAGAYGTHDVGSGTAEDGVVHVDPDTP
ncbi:MAG: sugar porter family MFS transporter, partial [Rhodobacteraceae bacterium]|nr:sugar porter family MFS transporter [Paracoccaceae bacterium]